VPLGIAALVLAAVFVPESRAARARRLDPVGQLLVIAGLLTVTTAIIEGPRRGWTSPMVVGAVVVAVVAVVGLVLYEPRRRDPLVQVEFFRSAPFTGAVVTAVAVFSTFGGFLFLNTLYLQDVRGFSPLDAGLATLPLALASLVAAPLSGRLVASRGARPPYLVAAVCLTASTLALTTLSATTPLWYLLVVYFVFGAGFGMANSPVTNAAVSGMPREQAGVAAATASTSRQVGSALGVAVAGSIAGASGGTIAAGFPAATHPVWWIAAACSVLVGVLGLVTTGAWARGTVERSRRPLEEPAPAGAL